MLPPCLSSGSILVMYWEAPAFPTGYYFFMRGRSPYSLREGSCDWEGPTESPGKGTQCLMGRGTPQGISQCLTALSRAHCGKGLHPSKKYSVLYSFLRSFPVPRYNSLSFCGVISRKGSYQEEYNLVSWPSILELLLINPCILDIYLTGPLLRDERSYCSRLDTRFTLSERFLGK